MTLLEQAFPAGSGLYIDTEDGLQRFVVCQLCGALVDEHHTTEHIVAVVHRNI